MQAEEPYLGQGTSTPHGAGDLAARLAWAFVQATVFRWSPRPWHGLRARLLRLFGATIPEPGQVVIFPTAEITFPSRLTLAPRAMVGPRVRLYNLAPIVLQRGANLSQGCHLCAGTHDYTRWSMPLVARPITIGANTWLGAEVFVGPGVAIGELCVVGARAVVVRDLPPRTVGVGNPCRPVKEPGGAGAVRSCHIVPSLEVRYGGPSKSVLGLATAMATAGSEVELLATDPLHPAQDRRGRLGIHIFQRGRPGIVCRSPQLWHHLRDAPLDLVHHHSLWLRTLHYAHQKARRDGRPLVISPRGMMDDWAWNHHRRRKALARAFIHPGALAAAAGWHATSESEVQAIRRRGFKQPVCIAPNGVAASTPAERDAAAEHWRALLGPSEQRPIALFYGRLHRKKRLLELIDLWLERGPRTWLLLIVGIPEDYSAAMLEAYVHRTGQSGRVRAFDGAGHPPPYPVASLFVLPSHGENFGLAVAEALAAGVPALVTDTTPWNGLNRQGAGWCVAWSEYGATLQRATALAPETLSRMGMTARSWVLATFSWERSARILAEFYATLPARPPA